MKTIASIIFVTILLSSCSGNKFLNRKYTTGFYNESHKSLKHNTIKSETDKSYASLNSNIELKKATCITDVQTEKEIINAKINSITKKDSIFHILKKGRDEIIIIKNNLPDVHVKLDLRKKPNYLPYEKKDTLSDSAKQELERKLNILSWASLACCLIPFLGLSLTKRALKTLKEYRAVNPSKRVTKYRTIISFSLAFSIVSLVAGIIAIALLFLYLIAVSVFSSVGFSIALI